MKHRELPCCTVIEPAAGDANLADYSRFDRSPNDTR